MSRGQRDSPSRRRTLLVAGVVLAGLMLLGAAIWRPWGPMSRAAAEGLLADARTALNRRDYARAESLAVSVPADHPLGPRARLVAGDAAMRDGRFSVAIAHFRAVPRDRSHLSSVAALSAGESAREIGRLSDAHREYAYVLEHQPEHVAAHRRMAFLLGAVGRRWDAHPHYMFLVRSGRASLEELVLLGDLERPMEQGAWLQRCAEQSPDDVLVRLGLAADALAEGQAAEAQSRLVQLLAAEPRLVAVHAMLGELLVDGDEAKFRDWHAALPPAADDFADIWFVRGLWARRRGELRPAARCFWETVRRAPAHRRGNYQLGQVLSSLEQPSAHEFVARASRLFELTAALDKVLWSQGEDEATLRQVVELLEGMGRAWEALAWSAIASQTFPEADWPQRVVQRLKRTLDDDTPATLASANLALKFDLSTYPDHRRLLSGASPTAADRPPIVAQSSIQFQDASDVGIDFVYHNGADPATPGARMFEQTGGGVGVLDYDGDELPDIVFTQGAQWKTGSRLPAEAPDLTDRVYRNSGRRSYVDVTSQTGLGDPAFGQGIAVGDIDNDGFPDLYVANIGRNRLYRNNGDGTFSDVTGTSGIAGETWTASCVIVDLNADGFPDLFDVTYLTGPNVYAVICNGEACSPRVFEGAPDRLHLSRGDGTFETAENAGPKVNSKGLGVVAADFEIRGRPCLFIANDQVPNFFLRNSSADDPFHVRLRDEGFLSGLAFNADGLPMASMGIAADDANGDGRLDFLVTTFEDEASMLFLQDPGGLFVDSTNAAGLRAASLPYVGWGTQFLDADRDGHPDLVVTNGHVEDYRSAGRQYHMRPQFFRNSANGQFVELSPPAVGEFFGQQHLGRGLARLDWNADGRMDFVVSHIGERASLVTNESTGVGRFLNVRLHAAQTARDAIGAVVDVVAGERRWSKQLVAGDGYMASNERVLQFGLGDAGSVSTLHIAWTSGATTTVQHVPADVTIDLVEGQSRARISGDRILDWVVAEPQP